MSVGHVTVVGSCMMDVVVEVPRLPETGETLVGTSVTTHVGGKGNNQAIAAARVGADVALIGKVGADAFGDQLRAFSQAAGVDCSGVLRDENVPTGVAVPIVLPDGNNSILAVPQANLALTGAEVESQAALITRAGVLLLQLEVGIEATLAAATVARRAGVPVILNTAPIVPHPEELRSLADVIVANETEAAALCPGIPEPERQLSALAATGGGSAVVTLGAEGLLLSEAGGGMEAQAAFPVDAVDTVGAGDAFCGVLAVGRAAGLDLSSASRRAQAAGAISATRRGAAESLPTLAELDRFLSERG